MANNISNLHSGHRLRMRQRFLENGLSGFADHEILEVLLYYTIPRANTNPISHALLNHFGSLSAVFAAKPEALMQVEGIGEQSAVYLSLLGQLPNRISRNAFGEKPLIDNVGKAKEYCLSFLQGLQKEQLYVICLDAQTQVIRAVLAQEGTIDQAAMYPRNIVEIALHHNAHSVLLAHNHPSGASTPSMADIASTEYIRKALACIDIRLVDHIVVGDGQATSISQFVHEQESLMQASAASRAAESGGRSSRKKAGK